MKSYLVINKERFEEELNDMFFKLPFRLGDITFGNVGIIIELKNVCSLSFTVLDMIESHMEEFDSIDLDQIILQLDINNKGNHCLLLTPKRDRCGNDQEFKYIDERYTIKKSDIKKILEKVEIQNWLITYNCGEIKINFLNDNISLNKLTAFTSKLKELINSDYTYYEVISDRCGQISLNLIPKYGEEFILED